MGSTGARRRLLRARRRLPRGARAPGRYQRARRPATHARRRYFAWRRGLLPCHSGRSPTPWATIGLATECRHVASKKPLDPTGPSKRRRGVISPRYARSNQRVPISSPVTRTEGLATPHSGTRRTRDRGHPAAPELAPIPPLLPLRPPDDSRVPPGVDVRGPAPGRAGRRLTVRTRLPAGRRYLKRVRHHDQAPNTSRQRVAPSYGDYAPRPVGAPAPTAERCRRVCTSTTLQASTESEKGGGASIFFDGTTMR